MSKDILLYESGDGGELLTLNNDISLVESLYQQVYLSLFGGNVLASTTGSELSGKQRDDWWGNSLLFNDRQAKQFNSNTERVLDSIALNSSGRVDLIRAIESDLNNLKNISDISIDVVILSINRIRVSILLQKPDAKEDKVLQFIWDNAISEVIIEEII